MGAKMNAVGSNHITNSAGRIDENTKVGRVVKSSDPAVMADIYDEDINLVIGNVSSRRGSKI